MKKTILNEKYHLLAGFISQLSKKFSQSGKTIYKGRNEVKLFVVDEKEIVVKSFKIPSLFNRVVYTFFRSSKAKRSYQHAQILCKKGIGTPEPIAYLENNSFSLLKDSYYACLNQHNDGMLRELRTSTLEDTRELICSFSRFTALLHDQEVLHIDYSPGNILYNKTDKGFVFTLVDINRMAFGHVDMKKGCAGFRRLWGTQEMISLMAAEYAKARGFDPELCIGLCLKYHRIFWKRYSKRHDGFQPFV